MKLRQIFTLFITLLMLFSITCPAAAATSRTAQESSQLLYNLGLFRGTGTNKDGTPIFDLDRAPTRAEAITMLVRLMGGEKAAQSSTWKTPFTDVPAWAKPYVGYAYSKGYTNGSNLQLGIFGSNDPVTAEQYMTFLLRALGYKDGTDFTWSSPWNLTNKLGITSKAYPSSYKFLRGDVAVTSANALYAQQKGTGNTLLEYLLSSNALSNSNFVVWDDALIKTDTNLACFLCYPVKGSPGTFSSFTINQVTVNSKPCQTWQVTTPAAVSSYMASAGLDKGGFCYLEATYDQSAAEAAATSYVKGYPVLVFNFTYTGVQKDGTVVKGSFSKSIYMDK